MGLKAFAGGLLFGEIHGEAPDVLALHGWGRDHHDFDTALADFAVMALDLPGFGLSPPPPEAWGSAEYAAAVAGVLDDFATPPVVVGHSFGGRVALQLAVLAPDRVRSLVLTGVPLIRMGTAKRPALRYRLTRGLRRYRLVGEAALDRARQRYGSADYRAAQGVMREVLVKTVNESYETELERVTCPIELVWGEDDTAAPVAVARRAAGLAKTAHLDVGSGDHFAWLKDPGPLQAAVERSLAS